jgi:hypothetical protein
MPHVGELKQGKQVLAKVEEGELAAVTGAELVHGDTRLIHVRTEWHLLDKGN